MNYRPLFGPAMFLLLSLSAQAQPKPGGNSPFRTDLQKVVADFPHGFAAIRGELLEKGPQTVEYASTVKPEGSAEATIIRYSSDGKQVYSWQTVLLHSDDFEEAAKKYKWAFGQLKGMNVRYVVDQYTLEGRYDKPIESKSFASSDLHLNAPPDNLRKLKVRVQLQYEGVEWKVSLLVFEKEREDTDMANSD